MRVLIYSPGPPSKSHYLISKLGNALRGRGHSIGERFFGAYQEWEPADIVITVGWNGLILRIHDDQIATGRNSLSLSDGYVVRGWEEGQYFGVTKNGLHAYGDRVENCPDDRLRILENKGLQVLPWRDDSKSNHILICHQDVPDYRGRDRQPFFNEAIEMIRMQSDRPIIVRAHPRAISGIPESWNQYGFTVSKSSLDEDLKNCHALVTYDSNAATEAVIAGVPAFTHGKTMADPVANFDIMNIEDPSMPDRHQWLCNLAYSQWTQEELGSLLPWIFLFEKEDPKNVDMQYYLGSPLPKPVLDVSKVEKVEGETSIPYTGRNYEDEDEDQDDGDDEGKGKLLSMSKAELVDYAFKNCGLRAKSKNKQQIIEMIQEFWRSKG